MAGRWRISHFKVTYDGVFSSCPITSASWVSDLRGGSDFLKVTSRLERRGRDVTVYICPYIIKGLPPTNRLEWTASVRNYFFPVPVPAVGATATGSGNKLQCRSQSFLPLLHTWKLGALIKS